MGGHLTAQELNLQNTASSNVPTAATSKPAALPTLPPAPRSPVSLFRELLAMNQQERQTFLAARTPEARKSIEKKISEYQMLSPEQRELRLRVTELRYYLLRLMPTPATNRTAQLAMIPPELQPLVQDRLQSWDKLSPEKQKELLDNEAVINQFYYFDSTTPLQQSNLWSRLSPEQKKVFQQALEKWQNLGEEQRQAIIDRFAEYFELKPHEQAKVLRTLSEEERRQIEKTIASFRHLDPARRLQVARSLNKFFQLSATERVEFLNNAERWEALTPSQRQAWRNLVSNISRQPPLPPGLQTPPPPPFPKPPLPQALKPVMATNQ